MALILMVLDHIHYILGFTGVIPEAFSMLGRLAAPLFLFCLVEGFSKTRNRRKYFLKVYLVSVGMSALLVAMNVFGLLRRPDGFYPMNGMMTAFAILMVIYQGIDWLGQKRIVRGLLAVILPLAWPFIFTALVTNVPVLRLPLVVAGIHVAAAFPLISRLLALLNLYNVGLYAVCTLVCFLVFGVMYILVYALTSGTYYRIVSR